ncbi:hypothetical protein SDC9_61499 [bioreactor metagenome]|uniref:Uncharacterized protein n=1 Tax=bioreactor metagenome TaxID=1076179 RepID=A0A644XLN1_9ZZZZ
MNDGGIARRADRDERYVRGLQKIRGIIDNQRTSEKDAVHLAVGHDPLENRDVAFRDGSDQYVVVPLGRRFTDAHQTLLKEGNFIIERFGRNNNTNVVRARTRKAAGNTVWRETVHFRVVEHALSRFVADAPVAGDGARHGRFGKPKFRRQVAEH